MGLLFAVRKLHRLFFAACTLIAFSASTHALPSHDWLLAQQSTTGSFETSTPLANSTQSTQETLTALSIEPISAASVTQLAQDFLAHLELSDTESLSRIITSYPSGDPSIQTLLNNLLSRQNGDGGFGSYLDYESDPLSTAFALRALSGAATSTFASQAVEYLLSERQADGSWQLDGASSIALTSEIVLSLANQTQIKGVSAALAAARTYLASHQVSDHSWGQTFESALAISALATGANTASELSLNTQAIASRMSANNSWHDDVYTTALVLQAFKRASSVANASTGKGTVTGQLVLVGSTQPVSGASVVIQNTNLQVTTNNNGQFTIANVPAGSQTLLVSKNGFASTSAAAVVKNAAITDVGQVVIGQQQAGNFVTGKIIASGSLQAILGAHVSVSGPSQVNVSSNTFGQFEFTNLPVGSYSFAIEAMGYYSVAGSFVVEAGRNIQMNQVLVSLDSPLVNDPASLSGTVIDGSNGAGIAGAQVSIDGAAFTANMSGEFISSLVQRGGHRIQISAPNYSSAVYDINFPAGAAGNLGKLSLYRATSTSLPTTLNLFATTVDGVSGAPISGAVIKVLNSAISVTTGVNGSASLPPVSQLTVNLEISAIGYTTQQLSVTASAFGSVAATFKLFPVTNDVGQWSLSGILRDEASQSPISGASVALNGGALTTQTDSNGHYAFSNIPSAELTLSSTATGYLPIQRSLVMGNTKGAYVVNFTMTAVDENSDIHVLAVAAPFSVEPDSNELINLEIENRSAVKENVLVIVKLIDQSGEEVDSFVPYLPGTEILNPHVEFAANSELSLQVPWSVKQTTAGDYTLRAEVIAAGSISRDLPRGRILSAGFTETTVNGVSAFGGALDIKPPVSQAGAVIPFKLNALLRNTGNQLLSAGNYEINIADDVTGVVYFHAQASANALAQNEVAPLDFGTWTPALTQIGQMKVSITRPDQVRGKISGSVYIGDVAKAEYTIDKNVVNEGDSNIKGTVRLTGVDTKLGVSVDPLFVLVKNSVEKGASFTGPAAIQWDKAHQCLGCHIQAQSLAGIGSALNKATVDPLDANYLLNSIATAQRSNGSLETAHPEYTKTATLFGAWALTEWPKPEQSFRTQVKALEQLWNSRSVGAGTVFWNQDHNTGWINNSISASSVAALIASRTLDSDKVIADSVSDYRWGNSLPLAAGGVGDHVIKSIGDVIYVAKPNGRLELIDPITSATQVIFSSVSGVTGRINGLDRDAEGNFWMTTEQGRLLKVTEVGAVVKNIVICDTQTGGMLIDPEGQFIYVTCLNQNQLKRINLTTDVIETLVSGGLFNKPYGLAWARDGSLRIANYAANNILKFDPKTLTLSIFSDGIYGHPIQLAMDGHDNLFIATAALYITEEGSVQRARPDGTAEKILWGNAPFGITSHQGKIYVDRNTANTLIAVDEIPLNKQVLNSFRDAMPSIAQYLLNVLDINSNDNILQSSNLIGLAEVRKYLPDGAQRDLVDARIVAIAERLRQRQAPNGGWSPSGIAESVDADPLRTALVGIALEYTSPSAQDPMVRNAITYLLNEQKPNGAWHTNAGLFDTDLGTTGLVMVYMPKALDRIGGLDVKLTLQQPSNVVLSNPSFVPDLITPLTDGSTQYLWDLKGVTGNGRDLTFDLAVSDLKFNETRPVSSSAQIAFANSFTDETITNLISVPDVKTAINQTLTLQTNKSIYLANEPVQISGLVNNLGTTFNGTVQLNVHSADNHGLIASLPTLNLGSLAPTTSQSLASEWNTGNSFAGNYEIVGQLIDALGRVVAESSVSVTVAATANNGTSLTAATVFTDKSNYRVGETVSISSTARNTALNSILSPSLGKIKVTDAQARVVLERSIAVPQLVTGDLFTRLTPLSLVDVAPGNYFVAWTIYDATGANVLAVANAVFVVTAEQLQNLTGTVTVQKPEIDRGATQTCDFGITNRGSQTMANVAVKRSVVAIDTQLVKQENNAVPSLAAGASQPYKATVPTEGYIAGNYACVLEATVGGNTTVLATGLFTVKESPIKLTGDIVLGNKARLLVLIDPSSSPAEADYLRGILDNAQWLYTIVDNAAAFKTEMTNGGYGVYALLSERVTLDQATLDSLKAKVAAGDGLLVGGATDRRHQSLEPVLGITARANEAYAKGISVKDSALGFAWERAFKKSSRVLNFKPNGATVVGEYRNNLPGADTQTVLGGLGAASRYGNLVLDNHTSLSSAVEGRLAVGGNLSLQNFSVGDKLDPTKLVDVVTVGGTVTFPSGRIYYGNLIAGGSVTGVGDPVRYGMTPGAVIRGNTALDINFQGEREYLLDLSAGLAALPANGTSKLQYGGMVLKGNCTSGLQVFNVNAAELATATSFNVSCIPSGATVIFNVLGTSVTIQNIGMQSLTTMRDKVLFNFPQATSLKLTSVGIEGSILAPLAQVNQPAGRVEGQVMVKTWYSTTTGYMSLHHRFFGGDLSAAMSQTSKNALSIYQYQSGKTVFAGFDVLAQAKALGAVGDAQFGQLLLAALDFVNPASIGRAGKTVPVVITYANSGSKLATGQVKATLTGGVTMIKAGPFTGVNSTSDWVMPLNLNAGSSNSSTLYVKLPAIGPSSIHLQLQTGISPNWATQFEKLLTLSTQ